MSGLWFLSGDAIAVHVETSSNPIIGYRFWFWDPHRRRLLGLLGKAWHPGVTTASCRWTDGGHTAPDPDCDCGLYADYQRYPSEPAAVSASPEVSTEVPHPHPAPPPPLLRPLRTYTRCSRRIRVEESEQSELPEALYVVVGAIALEGRVCRTQSALRGERARVVALGYEDTERAVVEEIAALYGARAVPASELSSAALAFGVEASPAPPPPKMDVVVAPAALSAFLVGRGPFTTRPSSDSTRPPVLDYLACADCGEPFMTRDGLREHQTRFHTEDRHGGRSHGTRQERGSSPG